MKNTVTVVGRNENGEVIIRINTTRENKYNAINKAMDTEEVTYVTTKEIIR